MTWPFETMTAQEVFDKVAKHLLTQNKHSRTNRTCSYRGDDGLMCAAGCLIPDDKYNPNMAVIGWSALVMYGLVPSSIHEKLIQDLQHLHDRNPTSWWKTKLKELATTYKLEFKFDNFVPGEQA